MNSVSSVSNPSSDVNLGRVESGYVWVYPRGVVMKKQRVHLQSVKPTVGGKRGDISGFSFASRRRMRLALLRSDLNQECFRFGLTITLPWQGDFGDEWLEGFRACFHRWQTSFRKVHSRWAMIFRVELQQRGAPHVHAIVYAPANEISRFGASFWYKFKEECTLRWYKALKGEMRGGDIQGFFKHSVSVDNIRDDAAMFRYLADHASKQKQAQLGYRGKQWGIVGKSNLVTIDPLQFTDLTEREHALLARAVAKICRYSLKSACPFGWKHSRAFPRWSMTKYVSAGTMSRLIAWARAQPSKPDSEMSVAEGTPDTLDARSRILI